MTGAAPMNPSFSPDESFARRLDERDPLASHRDQFHIPIGSDGRSLLYFCGHSLGLEPRGVREIVEAELSDWERMGVAGHFQARTPWLSYHRSVAAPLALLAGAVPSEVVAMNSLTVNLHLMMATFYRPTPDRHRILMEDCAFPSDTYAVKSQIASHGFDPGDSLLVARGETDESAVPTDAIESILRSQGREIALLLLGGVNYFTGQAFDIARIAEAARSRGCVVGLDLAHGIGNVPLRLHEWGVDFAVWCSYKYLNAGPGAVGGCFVHERHGRDFRLQRLSGWWGNDPATRFQMHHIPDFVPQEGAEGWQVSNPPILALAPLRASLKIFEAAGMAALRAKSQALTGYLEFLLDRIPGRPFEILTPREPGERGCQLSLRTRRPPGEIRQALEAKGVVVDVREPDVIRVAPVPLYNRFHEIWRLGEILREVAGSPSPRA